MLVTFLSLRSIVLTSPTQEGKYGGYADAGDFIFCCIVLIANIKILVSAYQINVGIVVSVGLSICLYIIFHTAVS